MSTAQINLRIPPGIEVQERLYRECIQARKPIVNRLVDLMACVKTAGVVMTLPDGRFELKPFEWPPELAPIAKLYTEELERVNEHYAKLMRGEMP